MCKPLLLDVVAPEAHLNDYSCVCELNGPMYFQFTMQEFHMEGNFTEALENHRIGRTILNHFISGGGGQFIS